MPIRQVIEDGAVPVKVFTDDLEETARKQLVNLSKLPIIHHHVAAMPDVHAGIGATVGSVIATKQAVIPAAVGVDIGCGMIAARTSLNAARTRRNCNCSSRMSCGWKRDRRTSRGAAKSQCAICCAMPCACAPTASFWARSAAP